MGLDEKTQTNLLNNEVYRQFFSCGNTQENAKKFFGLGYSKEIVNKYFSKLEKRFEKGEVGSQTCRELYDLAASSDDLAKTNLLENLMKKEFRGLRSIESIAKHDSSEKTWVGIDKLGLEYFEERRRGYGDSIGSRSQKQIRIANEIVERTLPYVTSIVDKFLETGKVYALRGKEFFEEEEEEKIRSKGSYFNFDGIYIGDKVELGRDLVNEISENILKYMNSYLPEVSSISGFVGIVADSKIMYHLPRLYFAKIPIGSFVNFCKITTENASREEAISELEGLILGGNCSYLNSTNSLAPSLVHESLMGNLISIDELDENEVIEDGLPSPYFKVAGDELKKLSLNLLDDKRFIPGLDKYRKSRNHKIISTYYLKDGERRKSIGGAHGISRVMVDNILAEHKKLMRTFFIREDREPFADDLEELFEEVCANK